MKRKATKRKPAQRKTNPINTRSLGTSITKIKAQLSGQYEGTKELLNKKSKDDLVDTVIALTTIIYKMKEGKKVVK